MAGRASILLLLVPWMAASSVAQANEDSFHCGDRLVTVGLHESAVLDRCGPPTRAWHDHVVTYDDWGHRIEFDLDTWTYDFGPTQFTYVLKFEDHVLRWVDRGDYGQPR